MLFWYPTKTCKVVIKVVTQTVLIKNVIVTIISYTLSSYCAKIFTSGIKLYPHDSTHDSDYIPIVQTGQQKRKEIK